LEFQQIAVPTEVKLASPCYDFGQLVIDLSDPASQFPLLTVQHRSPILDGSILSTTIQAKLAILIKQ
jgi:hypothetical protein